MCYRRIKIIQHFKTGCNKNIYVKFSTSTKSCISRRVVCTGLGVVCPLGVGIDHTWQKLIRGEVGVSLNNRNGFEGIPSKVAAFVPTGNSMGEFDSAKFTSKGADKYLSTGMVYALGATEEALDVANWYPHRETDKQKTGVAVGCGMVDLETITNTSNMFKERGYKRVSPFFVPKILTNMAAGHISIKYGFQGPNHSVSTACTTGTHAIGDSMRFIRNGDADVMICGGTEAAIVPVSVAGFSRARALSHSFSDKPHTSSRPFDKQRDGFVIGEGAGILVLEEYNHAVKRNATIFAEVLGYGLSGDAYHMTAAHQQGIGGQLCMHAALRDANIKRSDVSYINSHATSTPIGDAIENVAIKTIFGSHAYDLKISSCKGAIGHLLGAAGAVETVFSILALHHKIIPPTMNIFELEKEFDLDYVPNVSINYDIENEKRRIALKNSFGFGGTNAALCLGEVL